MVTKEEFKAIHYDDMDGERFDLRLGIYTKLIQGAKLTERESNCVYDYIKFLQQGFDIGS